MDEYKSLNKYLKKNKNNSKSEFANYLNSFISKVLISCILFVLFLIGNKVNINFKNSIYENIFTKSFSFATFNNWYKEKFGDIFPLESIFPDTQMVFSEKLVYESANLYKDGVALKVTSNYLIPVLENGIVIYMGEKEGYGNTVVIQQENGIDVWYSNVFTSNIEMYDYVSSGSFIGEVNGDTLYLLFQKDGEFLDYKDYI